MECDDETIGDGVAFGKAAKDARDAGDARGKKFVPEAQSRYATRRAASENNNDDVNLAGVNERERRHRHTAHVSHERSDDGRKRSKETGTGEEQQTFGESVP